MRKTFFFFEGLYFFKITLFEKPRPCQLRKTFFFEGLYFQDNFIWKTKTLPIGKNFFFFEGLYFFKITLFEKPRPCQLRKTFFFFEGLYFQDNFIWKTKTLPIVKNFFFFFFLEGLYFFKIANFIWKTKTLPIEKNFFFRDFIFKITLLTLPIGKNFFFFLRDFIFKITLFSKNFFFFFEWLYFQDNFIWKTSILKTRANIKKTTLHLPSLWPLLCVLSAFRNYRKKI